MAFWDPTENQQVVRRLEKGHNSFLEKGGAEE